MKKVYVSVLIPNKDYGEFVAQTIESVLKQTVKPMEIIVCDDNSTDDSVEIIREFPVKLLLKRDGRPNLARCDNILLNEAKGKHIAFLESDDMWKPNFLERMAEVLKKVKADGVYCDCYMVNERGDSIRTKKYPESETRYGLHLISAVPTCVMGMGGMLIKSKVFDSTGGFNENVAYGHETEWEVRATKYHDFLHIANH